jgi:DNA-directed RNA polymerase subunit RPC12/RpoP
MLKTRKIYNAFAEGLKPEQKKTIQEWGRENVRTAVSTKAPMLELGLTPWLIEPLQFAIADETKEVVVAASIGSGKTTLMETLALYTILERPNEMMLIAQTNDKVHEWVQTRLKPAIFSNEKIMNNLPSDTRKVFKKNLIDLPHMNIHITGANDTGTNSKSVSLVIGDECWMWDKGYMEAGRGRLHHNPFSRCVYLSQPGNKGDDFDKAFNSTYKNEFQYLCAGCGERHPWRFEDLKFDSEAPLTEIDPALVCPSCGHEVADNPVERRQLTDSAVYIPIGYDENEVMEGHHGFTYNALCVHWISWGELVKQFIKANRAKKTGDIEPLKKFKQQKLAQVWHEQEERLLEVQDIALSDSYSIKDRVKWVKTIMAIDKQTAESGRYYYVIRTFNAEGESRVLDYGMKLTYPDLKAKQDEWEIPGNHVGIDIGDGNVTQDVLGACGLYGWIGVNATSASHYNFLNKKRKKTYKSIRSNTEFHRSLKVTARSFNFCSSRMKDIVSMLKSGNGIKWEVAYDIDDDNGFYLKSLNAEVKKVMHDGSQRWETKSRRNDIFDCECMVLAMAMFHNIFPEFGCDD